MEGNSTNNSAWTLERHLIVAISMMARNPAANLVVLFGGLPAHFFVSFWRAVRTMSLVRSSGNTSGAEFTGAG
jgi:hypothetical protein